MSMAKALVDGAWYLQKGRRVWGGDRVQGRTSGLGSSLRSVMSSSWENEELLGVYSKERQDLTCSPGGCFDTIENGLANPDLGILIN